MLKLRGQKEQEKYQYKAILSFIKDAINDMTRTNLYELGLSEELLVDALINEVN